MRITIKYFGMLTQVSGTDEEVVQLSENEISVNELLETLEKKYPELKEKRFKTAVNGEMASGDKQIENDMEVALLPPFSGG